MHTVYINAPLDYVRGHLKHGYLEGAVKLNDEQFEAFQKNPLDAIEKYGLDERLDFELDDWEIDDWGKITKVNWKVLN